MSLDPMQMMAEALAPYLRPLLAPQSQGSRLYSQADGERPPGCGRTKFLRAWRRARDAGDAGATVDGRSRLLTFDAYALHSAFTRKPAPVATPVVSLEDAVLAELGGKTRQLSKPGVRKAGGRK